MIPGQCCTSASAGTRASLHTKASVPVWASSNSSQHHFTSRAAEYGRHHRVLVSRMALYNTVPTKNITY
eukprot:6379697-Amphidinium_carterae.1